MKGKTPNKQNKSNLNPKQAKTSQTKNPKTPKQTKPPTNQKKPKKKPTKKRDTRNYKKSRSLSIVHRRIKVNGFPEKNPTADEKEIQQSRLHDIPIYFIT